MHLSGWGQRRAMKMKMPILATRWRECCIALALALLASQAHAVQEIPGDPVRVKVLYMGEPMSSPLPYFSALINDPFFDVTPVQACFMGVPPEIAQRSVRMYMPRTYERLCDYQVVSLVYADAQPIEAKYKSWFTRAVREEGLALTFTGQWVAGYTWLLGMG